MANNRQFYRYLAAHLLQGEQLSKSGRALDLACGSGVATEVLVQTAPQLQWEALDDSSAMLDNIKTKDGLKRVKLAHGNAENLPYPDEHFFLITCNMGLHWLSEGAIREASRVLKKNGLFSATIPITKSVSNPPNGNQLLKRMLFSQRKFFSQIPDLGLTMPAIEKLFSSWQIGKLAPIGLQESFASLNSWILALESRGALHAIFGKRASHVKQMLSSLPNMPVHYKWDCAILHAYKP